MRKIHGQTTLKYQLVYKSQYVSRLFYDGSHTIINLLPNLYRSILIHFKQKNYNLFHSRFVIVVFNYQQQQHQQ